MTGDRAIQRSAVDGMATHSSLNTHNLACTALAADGEFPSPIRESSNSPWRDATVAIVHDWCPTFRGGERVLAQLCRLFRGADVFTLFDFLPREIKDEFFPGVTFHTSVANRLPMVDKFYRALFFCCPFLIEQFDITGYDVVISSSAAFARGVLTRPDQPHLCYVHSPIRYWTVDVAQMGLIGPS